MNRYFVEFHYVILIILLPSSLNCLQYVCILQAQSVTTLPGFDIRCTRLARILATIAVRQVLVVHTKSTLQGVLFLLRINQGSLLLRYFC